jgi:GNAT superfamily N-acetyltransferase
VKRQHAVARAQRAHYGFFAPAIYGARSVPIASGAARALSQPDLQEATWNHAVLEARAAPGLDRTLRAVRAFYRRRGLRPVVATPSGRMAAALAARGHEPLFRHAWLFAPHSAGEAALPDGATVSSNDRRDLEPFLAVFAVAFGAANYCRVLRAAFVDAAPDTRVEHLVLWLGGRPAACGTVAWHDRVAGLYNLGVHPDFRRRGLGAALTSWRLAYARAQGCDLVYLQTEDQSVEELQRRAGWVRGLETRGYGLRSRLAAGGR